MVTGRVTGTEDIRKEVVARSRKEALAEATDGSCDFL
jgi:hypothetical protein